MNRIFCLMFTNRLTDDVRDVLYEYAYLMIRGGEKRRKIRSKFCEGVVTTDFQPVVLAGLSGVHFNACLETDQGDLNVSYFVRRQDLQFAEEEEQGAWLTGLEDADEIRAKIHPNPIRRAARQYRNN